MEIPAAPLIAAVPVAPPAVAVVAVLREAVHIAAVVLQVEGHSVAAPAEVAEAPGVVLLQSLVEILPDRFWERTVPFPMGNG